MGDRLASDGRNRMEGIQTGGGGFATLVVLIHSAAQDGLFIGIGGQYAEGYGRAGFEPVLYQAMARRLADIFEMGRINLNDAAQAELA
ncbi:MAG: hypothetical protein Devi2KO_35070 [Devosia indica]